MGWIPRIVPTTENKHIHFEATLEQMLHGVTTAVEKCGALGQRIGHFRKQAKPPRQFMNRPGLRTPEQGMLPILPRTTTTHWGSFDDLKPMGCLAAASTHGLRTQW